MIKKILVAIDGSEPSSHALSWAVEVSHKWNAQLTLLSVVPPISPLVYLGPAPMYIEAYNKAARTSHEKVLNEAGVKLTKEHPEIKHEEILREGRPEDLIVEVSNSEDVDLIVMGSRGVGGITDLLLGSTSRHVVEHCEKPILIVK